jgi:hypothetical protein
MSELNAIVLENQKQGNPQSEWDLNGLPSTSIEGFTTDISANLGSTVDFKINTDSVNYRIDIYRLGYYGGDGARLVASIDHQNVAPAGQPAALSDPTTGLVDAGNWHVTDSWSIPSDAISGVYIAKLVRQDGVTGENHIPFIVRNDSGHSDVVFQTPDTTWQAYNSWGGNSLYIGGPQDSGAYAVSYNRPVPTHQVLPITADPAANPGGFLFGDTYPAIRWMEQNGYDVSYISGIDTARDGSALLNHKAYLSVGHDEYWSGPQFSNVQAARDAGVNLSFWSGNNVYWRTELAPSIDGSGSPNRTVITYKETEPGNPDNPSGEWTGTWRDPNGLAGGGGIPENALIGNIYTVSYPGSTAGITIPYELSQLHFWRGTDIANLQPGDTFSLTPGLLGFEFNSDLDNGFRPPGLLDLSSTTASVLNVLQDSGSLYAPGTSTHNLTLYRAPSGALVFSAGAVFWSWGLDATHTDGPSAPDGVPNPPTDHNVQQAMINLFADMGIQPQTIQASLTLATQSTDHTTPQSTIAALGAYTTPSTGGEINVGGFASDLGGGIVAGVEVSTDNGSSWHRADLNGVGATETWSYHWSGTLAPTKSVLVRAFDDSVNLESFHQGTVEIADFSASNYLYANRDVLLAGADPYQHYHQHGWKEGRDPNANFDTQLYLLNNPDVAAANIDPLEHYLKVGIAEGRQTYAAVGAVINTGFDSEYYLLSNPDVAQAGVDPRTHFEQFGWREGRDPDAYFHIIDYLANNPDVAAAGVNPLTHYFENGWKEQRDPSTTFDTTAYLINNPDVAAAGVDPLQHFLQHGLYEGRLGI